MQLVINSQFNEKDQRAKRKKEDTINLVYVIRTFVVFIVALIVSVLNK